MVVLDSFPFQEGSDERPSSSLTPKSDVQYLGETPRAVEINLRSSPHVESRFDSGIQDSSVHGNRNSERYFKCRLCHYQTKVHSLLRRHVIKHSLDSDFRCPACDFRESDPGKFVDHIGTHQSGRMVRCCFCPRKMSRGKLKTHVRIHRPVELYDCSMCQFSTNHVKSIKRHMELYHTKQYACNQCDMVMTKHDLHWHMKSIHGLTETQYDLPGERAAQSVPKALGLTSTIPKTPISPNQPISPLKFHHTPKISRKPSFALKTQKLALSKKQFNCGECDYRTSFKKLLRDHRAKHLLDNSLVCSKCDFKEEGTGKFAAHLLTHSSDGIFECCFCGFRTPIRGIMKNHLCTHKPLSMFDCSECEFSARRPDSLRLHTANIHRKKLRCGNCGVVVSNSAWFRHRLKCRRPTGGSFVKVKPASENQPCTDGVSSAIGEGLNDSSVPCELCKKLYAKSYVRRHYKICQGENAIDPDPVPDNISESNDEQVFIRDVDQVESPGPVDPNVLPPKTPRTPLKKTSLRCSSCFFKTKKKRLLKKHVQKHLIDFRLTCPECGHKEMSSSRFAHHIIQHGTNPNIFQCCFCSMSTHTSKRSHIPHLERHRPVNIFDCSKCEYSSHRADLVQSHSKRNHVKYPKCQYCGKVMSRVLLERHLSEAHAELKGMHKLEKVDKATADADSHLERTEQMLNAADEDSTGLAESADSMSALHIGDFADSQLIENDTDFLQCAECPFQTKLQSLMDRHTAKHLVDVPFKCPLCAFEHSSSRKFANHWDQHECNANKKVYQCCFCDTLIKKKNCLKGPLPQHIEHHRAVALQDCSKCEFSSHSQYELSKHYKNQHVKKCECLVCREVMTIFEYSLHTDCKGSGNVVQPADADLALELPNSFIALRRQSAEGQSSLVDPALLETSISKSATTTPIDACRPRFNATKTLMYCNICNYKTELRHLLIRHVQKHLIDVPYTCTLCPFKTYHERTFVGHIFGHTDSLNCHFCSFTAKTVSVASRHYVTHKVVAMYDCPKCEFTSTYKERTVEHLKGSHVDKPRCSYCGKWTAKDEIRPHEMNCRKSLRTTIVSAMVAKENIIRSSNDLGPVLPYGDDTHVPHLSGMLDMTSSAQLDSAAEPHPCNMDMMDESHSSTDPKLGSAVDGSIHLPCSDHPPMIADEAVQGQEESSSVNHQPVLEIDDVVSTANNSIILPINTVEAVRQHPPLVDLIPEESPVESSDFVPPSNGPTRSRKLETTACAIPIDENPSAADPGLGNKHQNHSEVVTALKIADHSASEAPVNDSVCMSTEQN